MPNSGDDDWVDGERMNLTSPSKIDWVWNKIVFKFFPQNEKNSLKSSTGDVAAKRETSSQCIDEFDTFFSLKSHDQVIPRLPLFFAEMRAQKFTLRLVIMAGQKSETRGKKFLQKDFLKRVAGWLWIKTFFLSIISQSTTSKHIFSYSVIYEHTLLVDTYSTHVWLHTSSSRHQNSLTISFHFIRLS